MKPLPLLLLTTLFFGFTNAPAADDTQGTTAGSVLSTPGGRYVFGQVSRFARHQYLLDTQSGRLWIINEDPKGRLSLEAVPFGLANGKLSLEAKTEADELKSLRESASPAPDTGAQKN